MKFIHCSDLHLDSKIEALSTEKRMARREEILRTFEKMVEFAFSNEVRAIIIAGDMFDTDTVTQKTRARVMNTINKFPNIDFLYLSGNHDDDNFINSLDILPQNLKVFADEWTSFRYENVVISGIKFAPTNVNSIYDSLILSNEDLNIVTMHGQVVGYKNNDNDKSEIISLPKLKDKNINYLALGHIHSYAEGELGLGGKYAYSGCLDGRGFDETGEKGFVLIETSETLLTTKFIKASSRILYEYEFDVSEYDFWLDAKEKLVNNLSSFSQSSLVKVVLKGGHALDFEVDKDGLTRLLNERFFFAKVVDKTDLKVSEKDYENDKSVLGEFVREVLSSDLDAEKKKKIIMCGINAIKGEEL